MPFRKMPVGYQVFGVLMNFVPEDPAKAGIPIIHANGRHDDSEGVLAAVKGRPFIAPRWLAFYGEKQGRKVLYLKAANYRFSREIPWDPSNAFVHMCESIPAAVRKAIQWRAS